MRESIRQIRDAIVIGVFCSVAFVFNGCRTVHNPNDLVLFDEGEARAIIVVAADATRAEWTAARELAACLNKLTGTRFNILDEKYGEVEGPTILVGATKRAVRLGIVPKQAERWVVRKNEQSLIICGGSPRGTLYAAYHFLEDELGVRWWTPWAETTPWLKSIRIGDLNLSGLPAFRYRDVYVVEQNSPAFFRFMARNRINGHFSYVPPEFGGSIRFGSSAKLGSMSVFLPDGTTRDASNLVDALERRAEEEKKDARRRGFSAPELYDLSPSDFSSDGAGGRAKAFFSLLGQVSGKIRERSPKRAIEFVAFDGYLAPPADLKLDGNVIARVCDHPTNDYHPLLTEPITAPSHARFRKALERWGRCGCELFVWEYLAPFARARGMPVSTVSVMGVNYPFYLHSGVTGVFSQTGLPALGGLYDMTLWIQTKLMENPSRDVNELMKEFANGYYGDAAGPLIVEYARSLETAAKGWPLAVDSRLADFNFLSYSFVLEQQELFDEAVDEVHREPMLRTRVEEARVSLDYATLIKWRNLCLTAGIDDIDLDHERILNRYRDAMVRTLIHWYSGRRLNEKNAWLRARLKRLSAINGSAPLPRCLEGVPSDRVSEIQAPNFYRDGRPAEFVKDQESPTGTTVQVKFPADGGKIGEMKRFDENNPLGFVLNEVDDGRAVEISKGFVTWADVDDKSTGYQDYWIMRGVPVGLRARLEFFGLEIDVSEAVLEPNRDRRIDLLATIKFSGASFPGGKGGNDVISLARIIAVPNSHQ